MPTDVLSLPVAPSILQRLTAWLCLAVALLTGITPSQGLMLCLESDGCVRIEIASFAPECGGCEGHAEDATTTLSARSVDDMGCPCVDLPIPGSTQEQRVQPKSIEFQPGPWVPAASPLTSSSVVAALLAARAPPREVPRPPESVALIRTVVLRV